MYPASLVYAEWMLALWQLSSVCKYYPMPQRVVQDLITSSLSDRIPKYSIAERTLPATNKVYRRENNMPRLNQELLSSSFLSRHISSYSADKVSTFVLQFYYVTDMADIVRSIFCPHQDPLSRSFRETSNTVRGRCQQPYRLCRN